MAKLITTGARRGFRALHRWMWQLQRVIANTFGSYMRRKRGKVGDRARVAAAMVAYAKLCLSAGGPHNLDQAASFLDEAAALYTEIGRLDEAKEALAMKPAREADKRPRPEPRPIELAVSAPKPDGQERMAQPLGDAQIGPAVSPSKRVNVKQAHTNGG